MDSEKQHETTKNRVVGKPFPKGVSGNPNGRPKKTEEQRLIEKGVKEFLKEYEQGLAEALPEIRPALIEQGKKGNIQAITEIHKVVGAHKKTEGSPMVAVQVNVNEDREKFR